MNLNLTNLPRIRCNPKLIAICKELDIPVSKIARDAGVSRNTAYIYMKGLTGNPQMVEKIDAAMIKRLRRQKEILDIYVREFVD